MKFIFFLLALAFGKDFYNILGISSTATTKEIKLAYKKLSLKYHPDKNKDEETRFLEINKAYEILLDDNKRRQYDNGGMNSGGGNPGFGGFGNPFGSGDPHGSRGDNTNGILHLSLKDFYNGKLIDFDIEMINHCSTCSGTGSLDGLFSPCSKCHGLGQITIQRQFGPGMVQTMRMHCDQCNGQGKTIKNACTTCNGKGLTPGNRHYDIYLKPGQPRDSNTILHGEGDKNQFLAPGDLAFTFKEDFKQSWGFRRIGNNLYRTEVLSLNEATNGNWKRSIKFFDEINSEIELKRDKNVSVSSGEIEVIKDFGMPIWSDDGLHDDSYGDLFIEYKVVMPGVDNLPEKDEL